ncbi:MAG TPA: DUF4362 domain-containing protein [Bacillales bacterium]|nr:DUF4362 domain-containing protein [Bacillales bacterium]
MERFYDNIQNGVRSDLRIVHYTIEGDPILTDLKYNGESLEVKYDTTRDKFGSGEIKTNSCSNMIEEVNPTLIEGSIKGSKPGRAKVRDIKK